MGRSNPGRMGEPRPPPASFDGERVMKKYFRTFKLAVLALRRNVLRSVLTTLGIIIGVADVIAMMEIGQGSSTAIRKTIASMGANNLLIQPGTASSGGVSFGRRSTTTPHP